MVKKFYLAGIVSAILLGVVLLVIGILIGHQWPQSSALIVNPSSGNASASIQIDNTLTVVGHGIVRAKPEIAQLSLGVEICDTDAGKANQAVNMRLASTMDAMRKQGLSDNDIIPSEFSLYSQTSGYPETVTYCALNTLVVTTDNLGNVSHLFDVAIEAGANTVYGANFTIKDVNTAKQAATQLAWADAQQQAAQLSGLLNRRMDSVIKVDVAITDNLSRYVLGYSGGGGQVTPQANDVESAVTVVYALSPQ